MSITDNFNALADFKSSLQEIDILCDMAKDSATSPTKYATLNKSALLLIVGKFESFIENIAEDYIFRLNELDLRPQQILEPIRYHHTLNAIRNIDLDQYRNKEDEYKKEFQRIGKLWVSSEIFNTLKIEAKFSYGKHGEKELVKLFERIGIPQIFDKVAISEQIETLSTDEAVPRAVDFKGIFNSVCGYRNNILHQDVSPSLNTEEIIQYRKYFEQFAEGLDSYLIRQLPDSDIECYI